jgi:hypothetical protein
MKRELEPGLGENLESALLAMETKQVPLLLGPPNLQTGFHDVFADVLNATTLYASAKDVIEQLAHEVSIASYTCLRLDQQAGPRLGALLLRYLDERDILPERRPDTWGEFRDLAIDPDHRLIVISTTEIVSSQPSILSKRLFEVCTKISLR